MIQAAATERLGPYEPPVNELWTPNELAHAVDLSGARHALDLIGSGLVGPVYAAGRSRLLVRAKSVRALASRPAVADGHNGALVVRVGAAKADTEADSGRGVLRLEPGGRLHRSGLGPRRVRGFLPALGRAGTHDRRRPAPGGRYRQRSCRHGLRFAAAETDPAHPLLARFAATPRFRARRRHRLAPPKRKPADIVA